MELSKQDAADYLGVSRRALERYTQQGKIGVKYIKGTYGREATYDQAELEAFKYERDAEIHKPALAPVEETESDLPLPISKEVDQLSELWSKLVEHEETATLEVPIESKLLLTMKEAQALTNLSWQYLRDAIDDGHLKAHLIGRGFKIKRTELEKFIEHIQ